MMSGFSTIRQDILNLPNILTLLRILVIPLVCVLIYRGDPVSCFWAVMLFWMASVTDWVDGYIARKRNLVTLTGKFLDPLADKLLVMACLLMLLPMGRVPAWVAIIIIGREITISSLRAIAATEGLIISANESGKFKTAFQMTGLIGLLIHYIYEVDYGFTTIRINFHILGYGLLLISVFFSMQSAFDYFKGFLKAIEAFHEQT